MCAERMLWPDEQTFDAADRNVIWDARLRREVRINNRSKTMLWTIIVILLVLWLLGLLVHVGGSLIHLLLLIALIVLVINFVRGRPGL